MPNYLSPGVYVEEVEAGSRPIEGVGTAVAAFVGLAGQGPFNTPTLVTNWTPVHADVRRLRRGLVPRPRRVRLLPQRRRRLLRRAYRRGRRRRPTARAELASGDGQGRWPRTGSARSGRRRPATTSRSRSPTPAATRRRRHVQAHRQARRQGRGDVRQRDDQARASRTSSRSSTPRRSSSSIEEIGTGAVAERTCRRRARCRPAPAARAAPRRELSPDDYVGDSADRTGFGGLEAVDEVTMVCRPGPHGRVPAGRCRHEGVKAVQLGDDRALRADGRPRRDPRPAARASTPSRSSEWRVDKAGYDSKYATLYWPWIKVFDPATGTNDVRAAERPHGRHLGPQRRHARRAQGARQRGRPRRARASRSRSPRPSRTCSTRSASTASAPSRAAASASGAPARCRATRPGATSTSGGSSTTSRSRSSTAPSGSSSSRTTSTCGQRDPAHDQRVPARRVARRRAVRGDPGARPSSSSATRRPTRRDVIDAGQVVCEIGIAPVKPAEFVDLPARPVLGRRGPQPSNRTTGGPHGMLPSPRRRTRRLLIQLEIDGVDDRPVQGGLGHHAEIRLIEHRRTTRRQAVMKKLPGAEQGGDITLKRGQERLQGPVGLAKIVQDGKIADARKNGSIVLYDYAREVPATTSQRVAVEDHVGPLQGRRQRRAHRGSHDRPRRAQRGCMSRAPSAAGVAAAGRAGGLHTEFAFELPRGYVDDGATSTATGSCGSRPRATRSCRCATRASARTRRT